METSLNEQDFDLVCAILVDVLEIQKAQITAEAKLHADLGSDSLSDVEIAMAVEEQFEITIPDTDMERVLTVRDLCNTVAETMKQTDHQHK